jgi:hypothetical protein
MRSTLTDDALTLVALGVVAFVIADMSHEALGHGLATLAVGGQPVLLTASHFSSSRSLSRWIPAGGGIANLIVGGLFLITLRMFRAASQHVRYFLVLSVAFNLLFAMAYPLYSGIAAFGDWAAVIAGLSPAWLWRVVLAAFSLVSYYLSLLLLAVEMRPFCGSDSPEALTRLRRITLIPYLAALGAACFAGVLNPRGWTNILTAAAPAAAGAFGLTQLDHFAAVRSSNPSVPIAGPITRSLGWIVVAGAVLIFFIGILGPGIKLSSGAGTPRPMVAKGVRREGQPIYHGLSSFSLADEIEV